MAFRNSLDGDKWPPPRRQRRRRDVLGGSPESSDWTLPASFRSSPGPHTSAMFAVSHVISLKGSKTTSKDFILGSTCALTTTPAAPWSFPLLNYSLSISAPTIEDNSITYWKKFVAEYYSLCAKKRWCLSLYNGIAERALGVFSQLAMEAWHCDMCGSKSGKGFGHYELIAYYMAVSAGVSPPSMTVSVERTDDAKGAQKFQEYIRVLVCNGKDQIQAKDDLEAFLGERSGAFVSWLWGQLFRYAHACKDASPSISDADVVLKSNRSQKVHSHGNPSAGCVLTKNCHNIQKNSRDELPVFTENSKNHLEQLQKDRTGSRKAVDIAEKHGADSLRLSAIATERAKFFERADIHKLVHFAVTKEALSSHFATCGLVSTVTFTDNVKGSAYITFASKDSVEKAWTLNGISFMSRRLKVARKGEETTPATSKPPLSSAKSEKHPQKPFPKLGKTGLEKLLTFPEFIIISNGEGVPFMLHPKHQNLELLN